MPKTKNPLFPVGSKFVAERGRFELPVPFEYTRFPIVLLRPARTPLRCDEELFSEFCRPWQGFFLKKMIFFGRNSVIFVNSLFSFAVFRTCLEAFSLRRDHGAPVARRACEGIRLPRKKNHEGMPRFCSFRALS